MPSPSTIGLHLLIPDKTDPEREAVAHAFAAGGGTVHHLGRFWEPPSTVCVYGPDTFCLVLQQKLGMSLVSPDDELLLRVPPELLQRRLEKRALADAKSLTCPVFIKPITPKQFRGRVYASSSELTWGAGLNGCDAEKVLSAIVRASAG